MITAIYQLYRNRDKAFHFRLLANSNMNLGDSKGYKDKATALGKIKAVANNIAIPGRLTVQETESGMWRYILKEGNRAILLVGQEYKTRQEAEGGKLLVLKAAKKVRIDDQC